MNRLLNKSKTPLIVLVFAFGFISIGITGFIFASNVHAESSAVSGTQHILTIHDNGTDKGIITNASTLRQAFKQANIRLDPNDITEPGLDEPLTANTYDVNIYRARPVAVRDGQVTTTVMTAYRTGKQIADQAGITLHDEDLVNLAPSTDVVSDGAAEVMTITRAKQFTFVFYGKTIQSYSQETTVGAMLKAKNITLAASDTLKPGVGATLKPGMKVELWRNGKQTVTKDEKIHFTVRQIQDANRDKGYRSVQTVGTDGQKTVTYEVIAKNGIAVSRKVVNSVVTKQAVEKVEVIGTRVVLPPGSHTDWMAAAGISSSDYGYASFILTEESGWNPGAVNSTGCGGAGCYGLGQTNLSNLSSACPNWQSDPVCQLSFFNSYVYTHGYGSWANAYSFWIQNRWW